MTFHAYDKILPDYKTYLGHCTADGVIREINKEKSASTIFIGLVEKSITKSLFVGHRHLTELVGKIFKELEKTDNGKSDKVKQLQATFLQKQPEKKPVPKTPDPDQKIVDTEKNVPNDYITPKLEGRIPRQGPQDTPRKEKMQGNFHMPHIPGFLKRIHPMRLEGLSYRREVSKWEVDLDLFPAIIHFPSDAHGITADGKHVLMQQASRSCVPTAAAMLILDHKKEPDLKAVRITNLANSEDAEAWIKKAGLSSILSKVPKENVSQFLALKLKENGPGVLSISHPLLFNHVVVLDDISFEKNEVTVRDPFCGAMVTVQLNIFMQWVSSLDYFLQVKE
jgi:hypothetical protein